jgi:hypothetical protein
LSLIDIAIIIEGLSDFMKFCFLHLELPMINSTRPLLPERGAGRLFLS